MKTFTTTSGYVFKFWEPGEKVVLLIAGKLMPKGALVEVITNVETFSRDVMVREIVTGKTEQFNVAELGPLQGVEYKVSKTESI